MSIYTNQLKVDFDIEAIQRDFAFIRFDRGQNNQWKGAPQLDQLLGGYQATSVLFEYGRFAYAMFRRPVDTQKLLSRIRTDKDFSEAAVMEVPPRKTWEEGDACICEAWLAQILLNSIASSRSRFERFHFNNLTGALLLFPKTGSGPGDVIDAVRVRIRKDYLLLANVVRHRKAISVLADKSGPNGKSRNISNSPQYVLHEGTAALRRWLPRDGKADLKRTYVQAGIAGKRANLPFLDFRSVSGFERSRAGILDRVLQGIREHLSQYMSVTLSSLDSPHSIELSRTVLKSPKDLQQRLGGQSMRIVDRVDSEESTELVRMLKMFLSHYAADDSKISVGKREQAGQLNFRIIHNADYYIETGKPDEYLTCTDAITCQHITLEDFASGSAAAAKTIVKELMIKHDIADRRISLYDWSALKASQSWTFGICDKKVERIAFMVISPDGCLDFRELDGGNILETGEYQQYIEIMTIARTGEWKTGLELEGLVAAEDGQMNLVFRTDEISLPDLSQLKRTIVEVDTELPVGYRTGAELGSLVERCLKDTLDGKCAGAEDLVGALRELGDEQFSKHRFRQLVNHHMGQSSKAARAVRGALLDSHGIRLSFPKQKDSLKDLFDASLDIKYFGETESEACYFVGDRRENVQYSFRNACHIRKVVAVGDSRLFFKELLPTMDVDFVRTGQSTVIPFPFKYLREYMKFEKDKED